MLIPGMTVHVHERMAELRELGQEHIEGVAVKVRAKVYVLHWPCRHCHVLQMLYQCLPHLQIRERDHVQGFVTNTGRFVDRKEAMLIARAAGQTVATGEELFSEDLW